MNWKQIKEDCPKVLALAINQKFSFEFKRKIELTEILEQKLNG